MGKILEIINDFVWGIPALLLIIGVGIYLCVLTRCIQLRRFPEAMKTFFSGFSKRKDQKGVSAYRAMCTALAATVGTGNLAGVAGAIAIGGPGAVFWMWICAFLGMAIKFAEATLAIRYRVKGRDGQWLAGPMYMIEQGLGQKWRWLAGVYCFFGVVATFGVGNATQINTLIGSINGIMYNSGVQSNIWTNIFLGIVFALVLGLMFKGGATRIGAVAELLVPFASMAYIFLCMGVLLCRYQRISDAFWMIIQGAFMPRAITGGAVGSAFIVLRIGASRGVFTNEAGMGTASIAHGSADVDHPVQQGFMGIIEVFLDTIVICTLTALVILCSGVKIPYGVDIGIGLTSAAFAEVYGSWVQIPIACILCLFAFATILGWGLYGGRCAQYLFGENSWNRFVGWQLLTVVFGAAIQTGTVWMLADIVNGLMVIPNLIAIMLLSPTLIRLIKDYSIKKKRTQT